MKWMPVLARTSLSTLAALALLAGCHQRHHRPCTSQPADGKGCGSCTMCATQPATAEAATQAAGEGEAAKPAVLEPVTLSNGTVDVTVNPAQGRITFYGFHKGRNVLWTNERAEEFASKYGGYRNWGGDKLWVWPQTWKWPPPFPEDNWTMEKGKQTIRLVSPVVPAYGFRLVRTIELAKKGTAVTITNRFEPVSSQFGPGVAAWSVITVPAGGDLLIHSSPAAGGLHYKNEGSFDVHAVGADVAALERRGAQGGKVLMDGDAMLATQEDVGFVVRDISATPAIGVADAATRAQIYSHSDYQRNVPKDRPTFVELEFTSATAPLLTAQSLELKLEWSLINLEGKDQSPEALADWIR